MSRNCERAVPGVANGFGSQLLNFRRVRGQGDSCRCDFERIIQAPQARVHRVQHRSAGHCRSRKSGPVAANLKIHVNLSSGGSLKGRQSHGLRYLEQPLHFGVSLHQKVVTGTRNLATNRRTCGPAQRETEGANLYMRLCVNPVAPARLRSALGFS